MKLSWPRKLNIKPALIAPATLALLQACLVVELVLKKNTRE